MHAFLTDTRSRTAPPTDSGPTSGPPTARALFIGCSDAGVSPALLTGAAPGELYELRTAAQIIPRFRPGAHCGVGGTLEFALGVLGVRDVILCGHGNCTALHSLRRDPSVANLPLVHNWFSRAAHRTRADDAHQHAGPTSSTAAEQRHLLAQLHHLRTYPCVTRRLAKRQVTLHAWHHDDATGDVLAWDATRRSFRPM
ncbi:carbonic anhydrase [Streptomyces noursei]|uniref:carbonic anhydrase n=1 Tax=Streptomyces noursei TaxID=1971 RepID=UPI0023B790C1|nr:carbonic anhydrase [Streptomyces noursei]